MVLPLLFWFAFRFFGSAMSNPWGAPRLPTTGDFNVEETYAAVGRIMSAWETIEFELCMLHSVFCGDPGGEAMRHYGQRNFPSRRETLSLKAEEYFTQHCNQDREGEFDRLLEEVENYYARRNEVAHGIVMQLTRLTYYRNYLASKELDPPQFGVVPPYHMERGHGADGMPLYAYTSISMGVLLTRLLELWDRLKDYRKSLPAAQPTKRP